jgi:hypothetical protein
MKTRHSVLILIAAPLAAGCFGAPLADTNSTGNVNVTGDESWTASLKGVGFSRATGTNAPACMGRLYDVATKYQVELNAHYGFGIDVGPRGQLAAYVNGAFTQVGTPTPVVAGAYSTYGNGAKGDGVHTYARTGGTITVTRFDAQRIVGTFEIDGTGPCKGSNTTTNCTTHASGDFDFTNEGCEPPLP